MYLFFAILQLNTDNKQTKQIDLSVFFNPMALKYLLRNFWRHVENMPDIMIYFRKELNSTGEVYLYYT